MTSVNAFPARVVVTADRDGRSHVVEDRQSTTRAETPTFSVADVWATGPTPAVDADDVLNGTLQLDPPAGGALVRLVAFPPDAEWKGTDAYQEALAAISGVGHADAGDEGMHATDTIDIVTVISGELVAILDDDEVVLRPGDSLVQRGTRHGWSNRTDGPTVMVATMISAVRP